MKGPYNFILIDDSKLDLFIHERLINISGLAASVKTFNSAINALQYLAEEGLKLPEIPETVILLDLQLPDMDGLEFTEKYGQLSEKIRAKITILMLSSTVDTGDLQKAHASPYLKTILSKPLSIEALKRELG